MTVLFMPLAKQCLYSFVKDVFFPAEFIVNSGFQRNSAAKFTIFLRFWNSKCCGIHHLIHLFSEPIISIRIDNFVLSILSVEKGYHRQVALSTYNCRNCSPIQLREWCYTPIKTYRFYRNILWALLPL